MLHCAFLCVIQSDRTHVALYVSLCVIQLGRTYATQCVSFSDAVRLDFCVIVPFLSTSSQTGHIWYSAIYVAREV